MGTYNVVIKDRIYIPAKIIDTDLLNEKFMPQVYNESKCKKCPYLPDRHSDPCDECPANLGMYKLYKEKKISGVKHYGIPVGNKKSWTDLLTVSKKKIVVKDKRADPKFRYKIKFIREVYDYQKPAVKSIVDYNNGILMAPPRSGKTVMGVKAIVEKKKRTLILASQYDWLEQFYSTIMGNKKEGEKPFTNIPKLEKKHGKKICVLAKDGESIEKYKDADIVLSTYQRFLSKKGKKQLNKIKKQFGLVLVDEMDGTPAREFTKTINAFESRSRIGVSATYKRKDGMHFLLKHIFGPILYKVKIKNLKPQVKFIETGYVNKHNYKVLPYAYRALSLDKKRNDLILKWVMHDLKQNRSIVIPAATVKHCIDLVKQINEKFGKEIACAFTAQTAKTKDRRTEIKRLAKSGKYRVIVGIRRMLQRGINVPLWDTLYNITPISNPPNYKQETYRILTPLEDKNQPIIRHFVDCFGFSQGCLRTCIYQTYTVEKFIIDKQDWAIANKYVSNKDFKPNTMTPKGVLKPKSKKLSGNLI